MSDVAITSPAAATAGPARLSPAKGALLIVLLGWFCYANSLTKVFVLDDFIWIASNPLLDKPVEYVQSWGTRWFVGVTMLLSYWLSGREVIGYHAVNIAIHLTAGVVLFDLLRRTLLLPRWQGRFDGRATPLALVCAALWTVHPLQTQSVTYIVQRCESLMGLLYLLTLYFFLRGATLPSPPLTNEGQGGVAAAWRWYLAAMVACFLGMGCKEVMVTAPVLVLVFDWVFVTGSLGESVRRRWWLYVGLALTLLALTPAIMSAFAPASPSASMGFGYQGVSAVEYARTQPSVILYYLRLALYPAPLCLDYQDWPVAREWQQWLPQSGVLILLLGASLVGLIRRSWLGYLGAWFFGILAITSSFIPIADLVFEHRMYLPLAAVVVLVVIGIYLALESLLVGESRLRPALSALSAGLVIAILGVLTIKRNQDYLSQETMWRAVIAKRPANARAHGELGVALLDANRLEEATAAWQQAKQLGPRSRSVNNQLGGQIAASKGNDAEAIPLFSTALKIRPKYAPAHYSLGQIYLRQGELEKALASFQQAVELKPEEANYRFALAFALAETGDHEQAAEEYRRGREIEKDWPERMARLAFRLLTQEAELTAQHRRFAHLLARQACQAAEVPDADMLYTLALAEAALGNREQARSTAQRAVRMALAEGDRDLARHLRARFELP